MSKYTMISAITPSNHHKITSYLHIRDITKEDQEQSLTSIATASYLAYKREMDYKGLNENVPLVIYHMARNIGCIHW